MSAISIYTIGGGDLLVQVFNAVAMTFKTEAGIKTITSISVAIGGLLSLMQFARSKDLTILLKWAGMYVLITSLILVPKTTVIVEDQTGHDLKPRVVDHVPLALAIFASYTSRIGIGISQVIETVFHLPEDLEYNKTGMMMGSKLIFDSQHFQITDPIFSENLNEFMQQCVFYDLLLNRYTIQDVLHTENPWEFIRENTSIARAFPFKEESGSKILVCKEGAEVLNKNWKRITSQAASIYGAQLLGKGNQGHQELFSRLQGSYEYFSNVAMQGEEILRTNLLSNAISSSLSHFGANVNATAALQLYEDTKSELQARHTMDQAGRQTAIWLPHYKNIVEAVMYSAFIFIYFFSYFPFGMQILRNYLLGLFFIQSLSPMYAMIHFAASFFAQNRSLSILSSNSDHGLSISNIQAITQANADALAVAGYLMWPVTIGGAIMVFRGLPSAIQSLGQYVGGVIQHTGSHVASETIGGNISMGNFNYGNRSLNNMNANHWDTNARYSSGAATLQTPMGSSFTVTPDGGEVLDTRGSISNLGVSIHVAESIREVASRQAQENWSAGMNSVQSAGENYGTGIRKLLDFSHQQGRFASSGVSHSTSESTGTSTSAQQLNQLIKNYANEHHTTHEHAAQVMGKVYGELKAGGMGIGIGGAADFSDTRKSASGKSYSEAHRYALDNHLTEVVDAAKREATESYYRNGSDVGNRLAESVSSSFDKGDHFRKEAASQFSQSESYSNLASTSSEHAASINANYTQEFYEWMRTKPSPSSQYGQGTFSKSAIDDMAIRDPAILQQYANEFVHQKTGKMMHSFEEEHHLSRGESHIQSVNNRHNQSINQDHLNLSHPEYPKHVMDHVKAHESEGGIGEVNDQQKHIASQQRMDNQRKIEVEREKINNETRLVKGKTDKKNKGGTYGSI